MNLKKTTSIISLCKGLPGDTWELPSMFIEQHFPENNFGVLSGPSYAKEVGLGLPTRLVLASKNNCCKDLSLSLQNISIEYSDDVIGVELGGCLKNIYAIGAGIFDGLNLGGNAKCSYLTNCVHEIMHIGRSLGAKADTFLGASGIGDLLATCSGDWSRNRTFGERLTLSYNSDELVGKSLTVIEGYRSTKIFHDIFMEKSIKAPIADVLYEILYGGEIFSRDDMRSRILSAVF